MNPDRKAFAADPFGYGAAGWLKWQNACIASGVTVPNLGMPTEDDLKSPILWLCHAFALSTAAIHLLRTEPEFEAMPVTVRGVCDCQFTSVALMLVGYSLEVSLKALVIVNHGLDDYKKTEKYHRHHELVRLAEIIPDLNDKEKAMLKLLTHYTKWAGRYPDPGTKHFSDAENIFNLAEKYKVTGGDLFKMSAKVMDTVSASITRMTLST